MPTAEKKKETRRRLRRRLRVQPGALPGTLTADPEAIPTKIHAIAYGPDGCKEQDIDDIAALGPLREKWPVVWVDVAGLGGIERIEQLGREFNLHRLSLEDVVNLGQRTKIDEFDEHLFLVFHMVHVDPNLYSEQISLFLGKGFVITFQEQSEDCFDSVRARLREGRGRIRAAAADYLTYALLDAVVDDYFPVLERYEEQLDTLERAMVSAHHDFDLLGSIHQARRDLRLLRRLLWPLEVVLERLMAEKEPFLIHETLPYLRDCHDHAQRVVEAIDSLRDLASNLMDYHLSILNNRMNEVMKVLTVVAAIFIPLTFIAGVYGMNFSHEASWWNMPELFEPYAYPIVLGVMLLVALGLLYYFRRKRWI